MKPIRTILTILAGGYLGTIPVEFGQILISGLRKEVVLSFPYIIQSFEPRAGSILTSGT